MINKILNSHSLNTSGLDWRFRLASRFAGQQAAPEKGFQAHCERRCAARAARVRLAADESDPARSKAKQPPEQESLPKGCTRLLVKRRVSVKLNLDRHCLTAGVYRPPR